MFKIRDKRIAVPLAEGELTIGRASGCDLKLLGASLSRRHACIRQVDGGHALVDLESSGGTFLNDARLVPGVARPLSAGDRIRMGALEFNCVLGAADAEEAPGEFDWASEEGLAEDDAGPVDLLLETISELHGHADPTSLLPAIVDRVIRFTGAERGLLLVRGEDGLETTVARDRAGEDLADVATISRSVPLRVMETGESVCITGNVDEGGLPRSASMNDFDLQAILCVPIRQRGSLVGVVYVDTQGADPSFGEAERGFLDAFAAQCGLALERARLRREEVEERRRLEEENQALRGDAPIKPLAVSEVMQGVQRSLERVADSEATILIHGETGVGKEVLTRYAHAVSHRRAGPIVVVDCGAIPEALLESVLFGHIEGAFTGASRDNEGLVARARGGTLMLDEIGELSLALQPKLLRFLEEQTYLPVGGDERKTADVRIVACTHRDLRAMVSAGTFREDLFFRLSTFPITVPPLRERVEDVVPLARLLLARVRRASSKPALTGFTYEALAALKAYAWPGNVRELGNRIERAVVVGDAPFVTVADLGLPAAPGQTSGLQPLKDARKEATRRFEVEYVSELLRHHKGQVVKAAKEAGVSRQFLQRLMARHGLSKQQFSPD